jgi:hypothetical protein
MIDSLQDWRAKNQEAPFKEWDGDTKKEFNVSLFFVLLYMLHFTLYLIHSTNVSPQFIIEMAQRIPRSGII